MESKRPPKIASNFNKKPHMCPKLGWH